ncbi:MAG: Hsp20 family protein [Dongiaceae bacterium]
MTRLSLSANPLLLGFDHVDRLLDRIAKQPGDGYPPFNIEQTGESALRIVLAVAGFAADELSVQVEDHQLIVRGRQAEQPERIYLHRGIAARQFRRVFVLADGLEVANAALEDGILAIDITRPATVGTVRSIAIRTPETAAAANGAAPASRK